MRRGDFATLEVTGAGLREGIFFERRLIGRQAGAGPALRDARAA